VPQIDCVGQPRDERRLPTPPRGDKSASEHRCRTGQTLKAEDRASEQTEIAIQPVREFMIRQTRRRD
jgi:hypothetical protein